MNNDEILISEVQKYEVLYDKSKSGYKNTKYKLNIWAKIAEKVGCSDEQCIKRWRSLRDRFLKEFKKTELPSGSASGDHMQWEHYESLLFLKDHIKPRRMLETKPGDCTLQESQTIFLDENDQSLLSGEGSSNTSGCNGAKKKKNIDSKFEALTNQFESAIENFNRFCQEPESDEFEHFLRAVSTKLKRLSQPLKNNAILEITEYVIKLENFENGLMSEMPKLV